MRGKGRSLVRGPTIRRFAAAHPVEVVAGDVDEFADARAGTGDETDAGAVVGAEAAVGVKALVVGAGAEVGAGATVCAGASVGARSNNIRKIMGTRSIQTPPEAVLVSLIEPT
jgi:hypothetical protein